MKTVCRRVWRCESTSIDIKEGDHAKHATAAYSRQSEDDVDH